MISKTGKLWPTVTVLLLCCISKAQPNGGEGAAPPPPSQNHLEQLHNCRAGILDPVARPEDRRRWIDTLLTFDTPSSRQLTAELLRMGDRADIQQALCEVISAQATAAPHRLAAEFIDPLIDLLASPDEALRGAAASALSRFPHPQATSKLRAIAANAGADRPVRLAAIDALAFKVDRREVVDTLVSLLDEQKPEITHRVVAALQPLTNEDFDNDIQRWRLWWEEKSKLGAEAWLADQLQIYRDGLSRLRDEYDTYRTQSSVKHAALAARLGEFQRDLFRALEPAEQDRRLVLWLNDPLEEVNLTALSLIRARIADEGSRPVGEVLTTLLGRLRTGSPAIKREVLLIVQTLDDPAVIDGVLAQLDVENDPQTRSAILRAIGRLNNPKALNALVREISSVASDSTCVREAATALGQIAAAVENREVLLPAIPAVKSRFQQIGEDDEDLESALLTAMAGIAHKDFAEEFLSGIESDNADIVRPAIRGLQAIDNRTKNVRLRALSAHSDPLVRLAAVKALGALGGEEVDTESLLTRLNPSIESNKSVRDAAWQAFRNLVAKKPIADQIASAGRLREVPDLEIQFLTDLARTMSPTNGQAGDLDVVYDRLGALLFSTGKYADAATHLRSLFELRTAQKKENAESAGLRWLDAMLRVPGYPQLGDGVSRLVRGLATESRSKIVTAISTYIDALPQPIDPVEHSALLEELRAVPAELFGPDWALLLGKLDDHTAAEDAHPADGEPQ